MSFITEIIVVVDSVIQAETVWGALYGLESLLQCVQFNGSSRIVQMAPVQIHDEPRYPWRGTYYVNSNAIDLPQNSPMLLRRSPGSSPFFLLRFRCFT